MALDTPVESRHERRRRQGRERSQRWRERHPGAAAAASKRQRVKNPSYIWPAKRVLTAEVRELKSGPCSDCGFSYPYFVMDFDHVRGEKVNNVGTMLAHGYSRGLVLEEISKCDLVCANCHRIRTWTRKTQLETEHDNGA